MSDNLSYLQANKLDWHTPRDVDRRHAIPGSDTKEFTIHNKAGSIGFISLVVFFALRVLQGWYGVG